jgi:hypothetical protein
MPTQNCTYKSITLAAGEQFILPPGAEIVATTNGLSDYTSTCPKPSTLESFVCYKFKFSGAESRIDRNTENWDDSGNFMVTGINVSGVYYPFASTLQGYNVNRTSWETQMNGIPGFNGLFLFFNNPIEGEDNGRTRGWTLQISFNTLPSIGDNLEFKISTRTEFQGDFSGQFTTAYVKGDVCT